MEEHIISELKYYSEMLETHFHDMMDINFAVESDELYILSARAGRRTELANLKIVISMFCEGKMGVEDVLQSLPYNQLEKILDKEILANAHELKLLARGLPASGGVSAALACFSTEEARDLMAKGEEFVFCQTEISPEEIDIIMSKYCRGVITARGGMTSHAAVVCRGIGQTCVSGLGDFDWRGDLGGCHNNELTIDGTNGEVYAGIGKIKKINANLTEAKILYELLSLVIKYNIITAETVPLIWRLWDVVALNKRYGVDNTKRLVEKEGSDYVSFKQPVKNEIESIYSALQCVKNGDLLVEDWIGFLVDELSAQVPLGCHYLYMRPILNPMDAIKYKEEAADFEPAGLQLTGVEFFHINKFVDYLLDIYSIKIYFRTAFYKLGMTDEHNYDFAPLNYLDYTNPHGESLIINTYKAREIAIYINDVLISSEEVSKVYHLLRRRKYHWAWYKENNVSKKVIIDYLRRNRFHSDNESKLYFLCEEMHLIHDHKLTLTGVSLLDDLEEKKVENSKNIDYILEEVILRGYNDNSSECNDFLQLIHRKDFKDLISLEIYEYYFWDERHEFDLQLLKEIVESVASYFCRPEVISQIETGLLQTIPSEIVILAVTAIWAKLKTTRKKKNNSGEESSGWLRIEKNSKKIDKEFENHDYVLTEEIETIFNASREEIQPLLKLYGCKCYVHKNRSIWIKVGTKEERIKEILKMHHIKYKK